MIEAVTGAQVSAYAGNTQVYVDATTTELDAGRRIAARSLAINAGDAVCGARLGQGPAGENHDQELAMLRTAGGDGVAVSNELGRVSPLKTKAEYVPDEVAAPVAKQAVERAHRRVVITRRMDPRSCTAACPESVGRRHSITTRDTSLE